MHFLEIICADIVFKLCRYQGRSQRGATVANAPARLSGARGPLTRLCWVAVVNFPDKHIRPPAANWSVSKCQWAQQDQIPSQGALERAGSYLADGAAFRDHEAPGALKDGAPSLMHCLEKSYLRLW